MTTRKPDYGVAVKGKRPKGAKNPSVISQKGKQRKPITLPGKSKKMITNAEGEEGAHRRFAWGWNEWWMR